MINFSSKSNKAKFAIIEQNKPYRVYAIPLGTSHEVKTRALWVFQFSALRENWYAVLKDVIQTSSASKMVS